MKNIWKKAVTRKVSNMEILNGRTVVSGIAIGNICTLFSEEERKVPHYKITPDQIENEIERFKEGLQKAQIELQKYVDESRLTLDDSATKIFESHLMILKDKQLSEAIIAYIKSNQINAEHAIFDTFGKFIEANQKKDLHFRELIHDFKDVRDNLLQQFSKDMTSSACPIPSREPVIIAAKRLSPYMMSDLAQDNILAFVSEEGGFTTHSSVLAGSLNIPFMFNVPVSAHCQCNDLAIVDANDEKFILNPDKDTIIEYRKKQKQFWENIHKYEKIASQPAQTKDGMQIDLKANINLPNEIDLLENHNFDGIGLLRTEFLFMGKEEPPTEEEQFKVYKHAAKASNNKPVTVRLLDIGADKTPPYLKLPDQKNPDLGIKGARAVKYFENVFKTQIKALLRAAQFGNIRILLPMISDVGDIYTFQELIQEAINNSDKTDNEIKIGAMIETPAAAMLVDEILQKVDFINIGSNDLLQFTLAASRENPEVYKRYHSLHPALIRLIKIIVARARKYNKEASLCGEIANYEQAYPLFLDLGVTSFSVPVSKHSIIKHKISQINTDDLDGIQENFMNSMHKESTQNLLNDL